MSDSLSGGRVKRPVEQWAGCYDGGWAGLITAESFSHPAKAARGLLVRIFDELFAMGALERGDLVCDPFGGIGTTAVIGASRGVKVISCELEEKFCILTRRNLLLQAKGWCTCGEDGAAYLRWLRLGLPDEASTRSSEDSGRNETLVLFEGMLDEKLESDQARRGQPKLERRPIHQAGRVRRDSSSREEEDGTHSCDGGPSWPQDEREGGCSPQERGSSGQPSLQSRSDAAVRSHEASPSERGDSTSPICAMPDLSAVLYNGGGESADVRPSVVPPGEDAPVLCEVPSEKGAGGVGGCDVPHLRPNLSREEAIERERADLLSRVLQGVPTRISAGLSCPSCCLPVVPFPLPFQGDSRRLRACIGPALAEAVVSSPPFQASLNSGETAADMKARWPNARLGGSGGQEYGTTPGQLGAMKAGDVAAVVSSPPYSGIASGAGGLNTQPPKHAGQQGGRSAESASQATDQRYGESAGQLARLPEGAVADALVSSPPYEGCPVVDAPRCGIGPAFKAGLRPKGASLNSDGTPRDGYGETSGQLGYTRGETFWSAAAEIVRESHAILKPGGSAVWIVKSFVRNKAIVDFPGDWRRLCEACGFELVKEVHAMLVAEERVSHLWDGERVTKRERKSFFRRLAESKGSPRIDFETVLFMVKR
jgi:hypothetical protein